MSGVRRQAARDRARERAELSQSEAGRTARPKLSFSFEFYDAATDDFCLSRYDPAMVRQTLIRLGEVNTNTFSEMLGKKYVYHFHPVNWSGTTKPAGFTDVRLEMLEAYQFALLNVNGQEARVFGAISSDTFFIVWFDLEHQIDPSVLRHT